MIVQMFTPLSVILRCGCDIILRTIVQLLVSKRMLDTIVSVSNEQIVIITIILFLRLLLDGGWFGNLDEHFVTVPLGAAVFLQQLLRLLKMLIIFIMLLWIICSGALLLFYLFFKLILLLV